MKATIWGFLVLALFSANADSRLTRSEQRMATVESEGARVPVLVELFTSEGCSSCPPADALLAKLENDQPIPGAQVIALEEHVDYWDELGWVDPFSGAQWTERQQEYASVRHDRGVYTPQMVVNGRTEFVGSRERQARQAIAEAAAQRQRQVSIRVVNARPHEVEVKVMVGNAAGGVDGHNAEVWLAITESGLHSAVKAGENSGLDVRHGAVVRSLRKIGSIDAAKEPAFAGEATIKLERVWNRDNLRAVAFVQDKRNSNILGCAAAPLKAEKAGPS